MNFAKLGALLLVLAILVIPQARAQTSAEIQAELAEVATYMQRLRKPTEQIYDILEPVEKAELAYERYLEGSISDDAYLALMDGFRDQINTTGQKVRTELANVGPGPKVSFNDVDYSVSVEKYEVLISATETLALDMINLYSNIDDADATRDRELALAVYDRAEVLADIGNTLIKADMEMIKQPNHPQKVVLECMIKSNDISISMMLIQKALTHPEETDGLDAALDALEADIEAHRQLVARGRSDQKLMNQRMQFAVLMSDGEDKVFMQSVMTMIATYDKAWLMEDEFVEAMTRMLLDLRAAKGDEDRINARIDLAYNALIDFEDGRNDLIYDRIAMLKQ